VTRAVIGTALCVPTASMAEGKRFNVLFQRHLQEEFRRASLVVVLLGGSPCRLCEFSCSVLSCHDGDISNSLLS
jgi:hypothetical protein